MSNVLLDDSIRIWLLEEEGWYGIRLRQEIPISVDFENADAVVVQFSDFLEWPKW